MSILETLQAAFRGPWGWVAASLVLLAIFLALSYVPRGASGRSIRTAQETQSLRNVPASVMQQVRQLARENRSGQAEKLLREQAGVSILDASRYVQAFQIAEQGRLSFSEALTIEIASDVKDLIGEGARPRAVKLLVERIGAPRHEAVRLVELIDSNRSHQNWLASKPIPHTDDAEGLARVGALATQGQEKEAVELYQQLTGASLNEATMYVGSLSTR